MSQYYLTLSILFNLVQSILGLSCIVVIISSIIILLLLRRTVTVCYITQLYLPENGRQIKYS